MNEAPHVSWSLGETCALATKAARGAGMPWGLAEETGFSVSQLHAHGLPGVAALCRYLHWRDTGTIAAWPDKTGPNQFYCPIIIGTAFMDGALPSIVKIDAVREPMLMLPFIGKRTGSLPLKVYLGDLLIHVSQNGVAITPHKAIDFLVASANCNIRKSDEDAPEITALKDAQRVEQCHFGCILTLQKFAKKTYAPATEKSRLAGAGAGLSDND